MTNQQNRVASSRKLTPWTFLAVSFLGVMVGAGVITVLGATDPWKTVIATVSQAVVLLVGWAVLNLAHRRHSSKQSRTGGQ